jgi:hypothetical protein
MTGACRLQLTAILLAMLVGTVGCGASSGHMTLGDPTKESQPLIGRQSPPLYVIPLDSLRTLGEEMPLEIVLRSGARVLGTPLQPQPDAVAEFHVRAAPRRAFEPRDTVQILLERIEVAVSSVPLASGSARYVGPLKLGPLPPPGGVFKDTMRPVCIAFGFVALAGAFAILGAMVAQ